MTKKLKRDPRLRAHLVQVVGQYGRPQVGVRAAYSHKGEVTVVTARANAITPVERLTVSTRHVKPLDPAAPWLTDAEIIMILDRLVWVGALKAGERQELLRRRRRLQREASTTKAHYQAKYHPGREWDNIGKGHGTLEFIRAQGIVS